MAEHGFLFAVLCEDNDCSELLESEDDVFLFAVLSTFMKRSPNRNVGYFEETVPACFGDEFASHSFALVAIHLRVALDVNFSLRPYKPG